MTNPTDMRGKVCLVTGANSGIGKANALALARQGATLVMHCRDAGRGQAARDEIVKASGNDSVDLLIADLGVQAAVRQLADAFKAKYPRLHILINNAGINTSQRTISADGFESNWAVNYLAPFLLTQLLLEPLAAGAPARVVNLGTWIQPPIDLDDLSREKNFEPGAVYTQSKTAVVLFTRELARRLGDTRVTVNCINPGLVHTQLGRDARGGFRVFLTLARPLMKSPATAARDIIYLATSPEVAAVSGKFFVGRKQTEVPAAAGDAATAERLWQLSEQQTGLAVPEG